MDNKSLQELLIELESDLTVFDTQRKEVDKNYYNTEIAISVIKSKMENADVREARDLPSDNPSDGKSLAGNDIENEAFKLLPPDKLDEQKLESIPLNNLAENILKEAGCPLHVNDVVAGIKTLGRDVSKKTLMGILRKDHRKRFVNLGQNVWDLSRR